MKNTNNILSDRCYVRLSKQDKAKFQKIASEAGFTDFSACVRFLFNSFGEKKNKNRFNKNEKKIGNNSEQTRLYHLARIGNNLNQLAFATNKAAHIGTLDSRVAKDVAEELMFMNIQISNMLSD